MAREKLTDKQRLFITHYLACWNATQAARLAGYDTEDYFTLAAIGHENLKKPQIRTEIEKQLSQLAMPAHEIIARLTDQAVGDMSDFVDENGEPDLATAAKNGHFRRVKKLKVERVQRTTKSGDEETRTIESVELYDAQAALTKLGEHHGLFKQKVEHTGKDGEPLFKGYIGFDTEKV